MRDLISGEAELDDEEEDESFDEGGGPRRHKNAVEDSSEEEEDDDDEEEARKVSSTTSIDNWIASDFFSLRFVKDSLSTKMKMRMKGASPMPTCDPYTNENESTAIAKKRHS